MISVKLFKNTVLEADEWRNRSDFNKVEKHEVGNNIYNHTSLTDWYRLNWVETSVRRLVDFAVQGYLFQIKQVPSGNIMFYNIKEFYYI